MIRFDAMHTTISSVAAGTDYPIFIAFLDAEILDKISKAPAFNDTTNYKTIADNVQKSPVKDWQRPLEDKRATKIASTFDGVSGEFMPNPVLLSKNHIIDRDLIKIRQVRDGQVQVHINDNDGSKPLWIIDGQHRIAGMSRSAQKNDKIPVVLLLDHNGYKYNGNTLAKIFAQVTTKAKGLNKIHHEWLTYAFHIGQYEKSNKESRKAFEVVLSLCEKTAFCSGSLTNPFYDQINFNEDKNQMPRPSPGGFSYWCGELQKIIKRSYYMKGGSLSPANLAEQIAMAHASLVKSVSPSLSTSVFFSKSDGQSIVQDAYLTGMMQYLLNHGTPSNVGDWDKILSKIGFSNPTLDWDFSGWFHSLSGSSEQKYSKEIIENVFENIFTTIKPINKTISINEYLRGDGLELNFGFYKCDLTGKPIRSSKRLIVINPNKITPNKIVLPKEFYYFEIDKQSLNIGKTKFHIEQLNGTPIIGMASTKINDKISKNMKDGTVLIPKYHPNIPANIKKLEGAIEILLYSSNSLATKICIEWK